MRHVKYGKKDIEFNILKRSNFVTYSQRCFKVYSGSNEQLWLRLVSW